MALQNYCNQNRHINHKNRGGNYQQQQQYHGAGNYNQYDDNSLVGGLSGSKIYATDTLPPPPRGPALVLP